MVEGRASHDLLTRLLSAVEKLALEFLSSRTGSPCGAGFRCADEADQLLIRTGEAARKQTPLNCSKMPGVTDRYLPGRSLIRFL